ncbi:polysaccharide pyruvyl transferase family protein [Weissella cibaria]|uniref:polysaccharide pyruvyl transferase family protein n=1 Tax=Weissella cibaria TaxID=137591 RepID=UPI00189DF1E5|nr:polysaccharide pyruvyl transferase family protein [Weissella cibaria]
MVDLKRLYYNLAYSVGYRVNKIQRRTSRKTDVNGQINYLIGAVEHGNYGDHAINIAEYLWFIRNNKQFVEIPESGIDEFIESKRGQLATNDALYLQGGGNMGDVWPDQEKWRQKLINTFPNNKIVIFPQSVNYDEANPKLLLDTISATEKASDLTIMLRDKKSYEFVKDHFPKSVNVKLVPDIVLTMPGRNSADRKNDVCLLLREDKEVVQNTVKDGLAQSVIKNKNLKVLVSDTVEKYIYYITRNNRMKFLDKKLSEIGNSKVVITDRLHGMIFSLITSTPVIVFDNSTHKIKNLIETWLTGNASVYFVRDTDGVEELDKVLNEFMNYQQPKYSDYKKFADVIDDRVMTNIE